MYAEYFGLNEKPFSIAPDPRYLYMSKSHQEALAYLLYGLQTEGGFVLLTGEIGTGKTTVCKSMFEQAPDEISFAFIINPKVTALELLQTICDELLIKRAAEASKKDLIDLINQHLLQANEQGKKTVIVIDEAQNLATEVLEQLRLLTNLETSRHKLLQIILLGQPELRDLIRKPELRQLSQRITARYHLGPLNREDTAIYILHRISIAGGERALFTDGAIQQVYKITGGVPRLINLLCDRALLGAYTELQDRVTPAVVKQANKETFDLRLKGAKGRWLIAAGLFLVILVVSALLSMQISESPTPKLASATIEEQSPATEPVLPEPLPSAPPIVEPRQEPQQLTLPALWPESLGFGNSFDNAFKDLAALWLLDYSDVQNEACNFAASNGLRCLKKSGSLESLQNLNRPAILTLYDNDGLPFYTLLATADGDEALFILAGQQIALQTDVLENRWFGEYFLLWQPPAGYSGLLYPGQSSPLINWLASSLAQQGLYQPTGTEEKLEGALLGALKRYQFTSDLVPDGVLGAQTIIQINRSNNIPGPRLYSGGVD
ncbi:general secretion pathway protein A [Desulfuromusa kysingii]|uniref:General secretion pathway protein A n=1 Tax=Desulfuromusa kysingii TaxID=37625 RepID=A0A1H4CR13_9BACT|nr:AAA family ATPase [Desulfuromusa kysingii]SEA62823.1 general secretion pathway protein A [Desulfuromusa kysingii]